MKRGTWWLAALCFACATTSEQRLDRLEERLDAHDQDLDEAEEAVARLSAEWNDVVLSYERAKTNYVAARAAYLQASEHASETKVRYQTAADTWKSAATWWRITRVMVIAATMIDARVLDGYRRWRASSPRGSAFSCAPVSTATFRRQLVALGVSVVGMDVDHIVPKALGGPDNPANYQLIPSSLNRSLQDTWNREKCAMAGDQCGVAIAVSKECGTYHGPWF
jgi:hypothetical protein